MSTPKSGRRVRQQQLAEARWRSSQILKESDDNSSWAERVVGFRGFTDVLPGLRGQRGFGLKGYLGLGPRVHLGFCVPRQCYQVSVSSQRPHLNHTVGTLQVALLPALHRETLSARAASINTPPNS